MSAIIVTVYWGSDINGKYESWYLFFWWGNKGFTSDMAQCTWSA